VIVSSKKHQRKEREEGRKEWKGKRKGVVILG
jgi:hypothetical protein